MNTRWIAQRAWRMAREEGVRALTRKVAHRLRIALGLARGSPDPSLEFVRTIRIPGTGNGRGVLRGPVQDDDRLVINWLMPDGGIGSGGHMNIVRMIKHLETFGHRNRVYLTGAGYAGVPRHRSAAAAKRYFDRHFQATEAEFWLGVDDVRDCDALVATAWWTAYEACRIPNCRRRFYFVQDYEPYFYPVDTNYFLALNSYRLGHYHVTLGRWLAEKLSRELDVDADWFPFAYDEQLYQPAPPRPRDGTYRIFFYARPVTPRRCFELGITGIQTFRERISEDRVEVALAGWDVSGHRIPFRYTNHGVVSPAALAELYRWCDVAIVFSGTNPSLTLFEVAGCRRVIMDLDLPNVRSLLTHGENSYLVTPLPQAVADGLDHLYRHPELRETLAANAYESVRGLSWQGSARKFEVILKDQLAK